MRIAAATSPLPGDPNHFQHLKEQFLQIPPLYDERLFTVLSTVLRTIAPERAKQLLTALSNLTNFCHSFSWTFHSADVVLFNCIRQLTAAIPSLRMSQGLRILKRNRTYCVTHFMGLPRGLPAQFSWWPPIIFRLLPEENGQQLEQLCANKNRWTVKDWLHKLTQVGVAGLPVIDERVTSSHEVYSQRVGTLPLNRMGISADGTCNIHISMRTAELESSAPVIKKAMRLIGTLCEKKDSQPSALIEPKAITTLQRYLHSFRLDNMQATQLSMVFLEMARSIAVWKDEVENPWASTDWSRLSSWIELLRNSFKKSGDSVETFLAKHSQARN